MDGSARNELSGVVHGNSVQAGSINTVIIGGAPVTLHVPEMLPAVPRHFLNRGKELTKLDGAAAPHLIALTGAPGIGKTTLAIHWAHRVREEFPDGQLFYSLCGSADSGPATPVEVLRFFLLQLGVGQERIPATESECAALFRSITSDLSLLIVLDDAASAQQVIPLLPSSAASAVLVTSRSRLDALKLEGFTPLLVEPFDAEVAKQMVSVVAEDLEMDPVALRALVDLCSGLPLALHVAAVRLSTGDYDSIAEYVSALARSRHLLKDLNLNGDCLVEAIFQVSYEDLPPKPARAYRLLGMHFGTEFGIPLAAAVLALSELDARDLVNKLVASNLLNRVSRGRYSFHNLVRQHARDVATRIDSESARLAALGRGVEWYLRRVIALGNVIHPDRPALAKDLRESVEPAYSGEDARDKALAELESERLNFRMAVRTAAQLGANEQVCQLCDALSQWYYQSGHREDRIETHELAAVAAEAANDRVLAMNTHKLLGIAAEAVGMFSAALNRFKDSLRLACDLEDLLAQQSSLEWMAIVLEQTGDLAGALERHRQAGAIPVGERTSPRATALRQMHIGRVLNKMDGHAADVNELLRSLEFFTTANERGNAARVMMLLAVAHQRLGDPEAAIPLMEKAIDHFEAEKMLRQLAEALELLATLRPEDAAVLLERAAEIRRILGE